MNAFQGRKINREENLAKNKVLKKPCWRFSQFRFSALIWRCVICGIPCVTLKQSASRGRHANISQSFSFISRSVQTSAFLKRRSLRNKTRQVRSQHGWSFRKAYEKNCYGSGSKWMERTGFRMWVNLPSIQNFDQYWKDSEHVRTKLLILNKLV